jgi:hypothetical protein
MFENPIRIISWITFAAVSEAFFDEGAAFPSSFSGDLRFYQVSPPRSTQQFSGYTLHESPLVSRSNRRGIPAQTALALALNCLSLLIGDLP